LIHTPYQLVAEIHYFVVLSTANKFKEEEEEEGE